MRLTRKQTLIIAVTTLACVAVAVIAGELVAWALRAMGVIQ